MLLWNLMVNWWYFLGLCSDSVCYCVGENVWQVLLTNHILPAEQTPSLKHLKETSLLSPLSARFLITPHSADQLQPTNYQHSCPDLTTCSCSSSCLDWLWVLSPLQVTMKWSYSVVTVPCSGSASTAAATSMSPNVCPGLMQSSTVCHRGPTWCLSTVWKNKISSNPWSRALTKLRDSLGPVLMTSPKKADGCGLMDVLWTLSFGVQKSQTIIKEMKTVFTTTMVLIWNGMILHVLTPIRLFVLLT